MTLENLRTLIAGEPPYRLRQAGRAIFARGVSSFREIGELPAGLRSRLRDAPILRMTPEDVRVSRDGLAHKAVMRLEDGKRVETVLMSPKPGLWTACISSQVGCALRCAFCATGLMGFVRNLTGEEITDQVLFWRQYLRRGGLLGRGDASTLQNARLANVVYMGMGEPMLNIDNVFDSLRRLSSPEEFAIGRRHLSVSTAGVAPGMDRFADAFPQVNLALSLHSALPEKRRRLVPIERAYPLERLKRSLREYLRRNRRKVFLEYVLLAGENDGVQDVEALIRFVADSGPKGLLHVNLIAWNPTDTPHAPSRPASAKRFVESLRSAGIPVTVRKNLGRDIEGACGQLIVAKNDR